MIKWKWVAFASLSSEELTAIMKIRQQVFVVEQKCTSSDEDGLDGYSWHLMGWLNDELVAYLRVVFPGRKYAEPSIGRVLTLRSVRGKGFGQMLLAEGVRHSLIEYPGASIRISAQQHLERFYGEVGFETVSEPYDEEGIQHVEMLRRPSF